MTGRMEAAMWEPRGLTLILATISESTKLWALISKLSKTKRNTCHARPAAHRPVKREGTGPARQALLGHHPGGRKARRRVGPSHAPATLSTVLGGNR